MTLNIESLIFPQRLKELLMIVILMMCLNQSKIYLYQAYKNHLDPFELDY